MKIIGIVAEYNPFHNGHAYQIEQCRKMGADYIIIVMSGNYVQRGEPAFLDKYSRTRIALTNGADLVLELPVSYSTSSAEDFSFSAISLLHQLGCVTHLCFGCENPDEIRRLAPIFYEVFQKEDSAFRTCMQQNLKKGKSYAQSRLKAALESTPFFSQKEKEQLEEMLSKPNNILALSYEIALLQLHSPIQPLPIKRMGAGYHDKIQENNSAVSSASFPSATGIRNQILAMDIFDQKTLAPYLPTSELQILAPLFHTTFPLTSQDFAGAFLHRLLTLPKAEACGILDMSASLWNTMQKELTHFTDYDTFIDACQSRAFPYSRIRRALLHALLGIETNTHRLRLQAGGHFYIRPLGFKKESSRVLSLIKKNSTLPLLSKLADYKDVLFQNPTAIQMVEEECRCDSLYRLISQTKYGHTQPDSFQRGLILL